MHDLDQYERKLLEAWEEVFKKGQLTLWIMLALKDGPKHMTQIKQFINKATNGTLSADDKSMYRALRRYFDTELVNFKQEPRKGGPDLKIYSLSSVGSKVLNAFTKRNLIDVFFKPINKSLLERNK